MDWGTLRGMKITSAATTNPNRTQFFVLNISILLKVVESRLKPALRLRFGGR
jgi:hypothetical protein